MRAKANIRFRDLKAGVIREAGDEFECSKRRFNEIVCILGPDAICEVVETVEVEPEGEAE